MTPAMAHRLNTEVWLMLGTMTAEPWENSRGHLLIVFRVVPVVSGAYGGPQRKCQDQKVGSQADGGASRLDTEDLAFEILRIDR